MDKNFRFIGADCGTDSEEEVDAVVGYPEFGEGGVFGSRALTRMVAHSLQLAMLLASAPMLLATVPRIVARSLPRMVALPLVRPVTDSTQSAMRSTVTWPRHGCS
jgi:hypothetical protein